MYTLLVISNEPALAETLESELSGVDIKAARPKEAQTLLQNEHLRLILADDESGDLSPLLQSAKAPVLWLKRPARLSDLLYTIREQLQGKTAAKEEIPLANGYRLLPGDRMLCSTNGSTRIALTEKEVELLLCLLEAKGKPVPRDALLKRVWGYSDDIATHTLETHIYRLRGKLSQAGPSIDIAFSEEGGYRLSVA